MAEQLDAIHIRDLQFRCIIGVNPEERTEKQDIVVNLTLYTSLRRAGQTDDLADTIDYKAFKKTILVMAEASQFQLIERLAERIAEIALALKGAQRVRVLVEKPNALRFARTVGVEIVRP